MKHELSDRDWEDQIKSTLPKLQNGDLILVPNLKALNAVVSILSATAQDVLVYVRLSGWRYHPPVGVERDVEL